MVAGDVTMAELRPALESRLGGWKKREIPKKNLSEVQLAGEPVVYLMDVEESQLTKAMATGNSTPICGR